MNNITLELKKMDAYNGIEYAQRIIELFNEFPDDGRQIDDYVEKRVYAIAASADEVIAKGIRCQLEGVAEVISLSYIARHYFNRSRQWLSQRINGANVNGRPAKFTDDQLLIFNNALRDIGKKVGAVNLVG